MDLDSDFLKKEIAPQIIRYEANRLLLKDGKLFENQMNFIYTKDFF